MDYENTMKTADIICVRCGTVSQYEDASGCTKCGLSLKCHNRHDDSCPNRVSDRRGINMVCRDCKHLIAAATRACTVCGKMCRMASTVCRKCRKGN